MNSFPPSLNLPTKPENPEDGAGQTDSAGKPASLEAFLIGGADGDGGSNFTGSVGAMSVVTLCPLGVVSGQATHTSRMTIGVGPHGTTGIGMTKDCPASVQPNTAFQCTFTVQNLDPDNRIVNLAVTNEVPFPGGTSVAVACEFPPGTPVHPYFRAVPYVQLLRAAAGRSPGRRATGYDESP